MSNTINISNDATQRIATGASSGGSASIDHITHAVTQAMTSSGLKQAGAVLLFLTNGYSNNPKPAIRAAASIANTLQVFGCSANGLISDHGIILDQEGAVAMVFPSDFAPEPVSILKSKGVLKDRQSLICLCSPQSSKTAINYLPYKMIGGISSNEFGQGTYPIWQSSRLSKEGFFHLGFGHEMRQFITCSQGIRRLSKNLKITSSQNNRVDLINGIPAFESVKESMPDNLKDLFMEQPFHTLAAISESSIADGLNKNFLKISNVVAIDKQSGSIHFSDKVDTGHYLFWALRDRALAEQETKHNLTALSRISKKPKFALQFNSISRGPYFFNKDSDADYTHFKEKFPELPMIGIYSTGEITPGQHFSALSRRYSSVLTVFD